MHAHTHTVAHTSTQHAHDLPRRGPLSLPNANHLMASSLCSCTYTAHCATAYVHTCQHISSRLTLVLSARERQRCAGRARRMTASMLPAPSTADDNPLPLVTAVDPRRPPRYRSCRQSPRRRRASRRASPRSQCPSARSQSLTGTAPSRRCPPH
jgi:hypothetical protein